jgi:hypothetical protein
VAEEHYPEVVYECLISAYISNPALSTIILRSVVGISLGQVLLQEFQVFLGTTSDAFLRGSSGDIGGRGAGGQDGLSGVELGELGGEVGRQGRCLRGSGCGVRLDAGKVGVGALKR